MADLLESEFLVDPHFNVLLCFKNTRHAKMNAFHVIRGIARDACEGINFAVGNTFGIFVLQLVGFPNVVQCGNAERFFQTFEPNEVGLFVLIGVSQPFKVAITKYYTTAPLDQAIPHVAADKTVAACIDRIEVFHNRLFKISRNESYF